MAYVQFAFVKLIVRDLEKMRAFYERALDLVVARKVDTETLAELIMMPKGETGGFCLVLYKAMDGSEPVVGTGHGPIGVNVASCDEAYALALREGGREKTKPFDFPGLRVAFAFDPEGHEIEYLERRG